MAEFKVGYFVGSLATKSINRLLARALVRVAPHELQLTEIPFKDLPLYSYDYDKNSTREFLQNYMAEFHGFIARVYTALPRSS